MGGLTEIPARGGRAARLARGRALRVINTHGHQVVDFWAFNAGDLTEFLSNEHTRQKLSGVFPRVGEPLYTNRRRPILLFEADTSPGVHDTLMAACDVYRYEQLGCTEYHANCTDNLHAAMRELGLEAPEVPSPLNLWMNIPIRPDGSVGWEPPVASPGDHVVLRAELECVVVMSACPQDMVPINAGNPVEAHFEII